MEQLIGLGPDAAAVSLDIWWPVTKTRQHFSGVGPNQYIEIKEFASSYTHLERHAFRLGKENSLNTSSASKPGNSTGSNPR
jgi:hypothetical protein